MEEYIIRLCRCGMAICEAYAAYFRIMKEQGLDGLERFVAALEGVVNVD